MSKHAAINWHHLQAEEIVRILDSDLRSGLSGAEAARRQKEYGPNSITPRRHTPEWKRFLEQFHQPLLYILLACTAITVGLRAYVDASVIFGVILINAVVGYLQEGKAEKAISALAKMVVMDATVRREGRKHQVNAADLVPGDIVLLEPGDRVPADLRLFSVRGLRADESALTGESVPVHKQIDPLALDTLLADRKNLVFAGTLITAGHGEGIVWATGDKTEAGRIAWLISETVDLSTPLTRKIAAFSNTLLWLILGCALLTFLIGLYHGEKPMEMFMAAVALAVGAIPEGLPAAVTITLAIGVSRMARRRAIIRKLPAVETLGSTTVICSDKTGTLTENQMTVQEIYSGGHLYTVTGTGYQPNGRIEHSGKPLERVGPALTECLRAGLLCNDALLALEHGKVRVHGDPTEAALIVSAEKAGFLHAETHGQMPRLDAIPFEAERQSMATLHKLHEEGVIYKKGAVERLLERSSTALDATGREIPIDKEAIRHAAEGMAAKGLRVLAFARRKADSNQKHLTDAHVASGLTFLGLQGMMDPPRQEAIAAIVRCQKAGISVKMITGDHLLTAKAVAQKMNLTSAAGASRALTGRELDQIPDPLLPEAAEQTEVFARIAPEQKLRLVRALQTRGHVVAMTGDGVNDAPALKQADIGIAMGITGTEVAKGAADMILTDDNFASIEAAVEEGRCVFDNLSKFIIWTLPTNVGEAIILLTAILFGTALPALPVQLLWINMATSIFLGLVLVFESKEPGLMLRRPRDPREPILTFPLFMRTGLVALLMLAGAFTLFVWELETGADIAEARTIVVNVIVMTEIFYLLNCRSLTHSMFSIGIASNRWLPWGVGAMIIAQLFFTYLPAMNRLFHSAPVPADAWLRILGIGLLIYLAVGLEKWVRFSRTPRGSDDFPTEPTSSILTPNLHFRCP